MTNITHDPAESATRRAEIKTNWREHLGNLAALGASSCAARFADSDRAEDVLDNIDELNAWAELVRWATVPGTPVSDGVLTALRREREWQVGALERDRAAGGHPDDIAMDATYIEMVNAAIARAETEARR